MNLVNLVETAAGLPEAWSSRELYLVPAGTKHAVAAGSEGTLVIVEVQEPAE